MWLLRSHSFRESSESSSIRGPRFYDFLRDAASLTLGGVRSDFCLGRNPMLRCLEVQQFALVEHLRVEFDEGLNLLTGETGSGKSILVDALSLLLGEKAHAAMIRTGAEKAVVTGLFQLARRDRTAHAPGGRRYRARGR